MTDKIQSPNKTARELPIQHQQALLGLLLLLLTLLCAPWFSSVWQQFNEPTLSYPSNPTEIIAIAPTMGMPEPTDNRLFLEVRAGDTLSSIFKTAGFGPQQVDDIVSSSDDTKILSNIYPGYRLAFEIDTNQSLVSLEIIKSPLESFKFTRFTEEAFEYQHLRKEPEVKHVVKEAIITESLFLAAQQGGIPAAMAQELARIFGGVIDFYNDTREGDSFRVLYEDQYLNGQWIGYGKILAAEFTNQGNVFTALRYEDKDGKANFYSPEGESMRKAFLQNPVDFTRISSGFSLSRKHPILNTIRAHKGTDYAAPRGTPVVATSDGRVTFADSNGSFGKLVVIQHGERFVTKYAHLNAYEKNIKTGVRVRQGDVIGYVGSTGSATGPHLHYEFLMDGAHRDSRRVFDQLPRAESISSAELEDFRSQTLPLVTTLEIHQRNMVVAAKMAQSATNVGLLKE
jgi:murein DD-endopeptidase MepM/ murein hydrolase activator NlpD